MWRIIFFCLVACFGFWMGSSPNNKYMTNLQLGVQKDFPLIENKSFVVVMYGLNEAQWCERALTSVFEQDFDHYRVIYVDDASTDLSVDTVTKYVLENNQEGKVVLMRNQERLGRSASIRRAIDQCLDREIVIVLNAHDWLVSPLVLGELNQIYQNPDVLTVGSSVIEYPSFEKMDMVQSSFYAEVFKKSPPDRGDTFLELSTASGGRARQVEEPLSFFNAVCPANRPF